MTTTTKREPAFLVLSALADAPRHGYAIVEELRRMSPRQTRPRTSTVYAALARLATDGSIRVVAEEVVGGRLRRYYDLTDQGRSTLLTEIEHLSDAVGEARRRLSLRVAVTV